MANFNKVLLMGNLTREPELKFIPSGSAVCDFGLAINKEWTKDGQKQSETTFVDITVWGKQAESSSKYLSKGSPCFIEGHLQMDEWTDKESGKKRTKLKAVAERVQFLGGKREEETQEPPPERTGDFDMSQDYPNNQPIPAPVGDFPPTQSETEGDIPF